MTILSKDKGSTFVGFTFETTSETNRVCKEELWHYNGGFMLVESWPSSGKWEDTKLEGIPCWVRIFGFPTKALNISIVETFAAFVGEIVEIPWSNPGMIFLNGYARAKIKFLVDKPVFIGKFIPFNGKREWIYIRFEDLPLICYGCGKWGA